MTLVTTLARLLLRLYPREWRVRYEDEVCALFDEQAPQLWNLPGLFGNAVREWQHAAIDPLRHPRLWTASTALGLFSRLGAIVAGLYVSSKLAATALAAVFGPAPGWFESTAVLCILIVQARAFLSQAWWAQIPMSIKMRPLTRGQLVRWSLTLFVSVTVCQWTNEHLALWHLWMAPQFLLCATPAAWVRAKAAQDYWSARREWHYALSEHRRMVSLELRDLATFAEVTKALGEAQRLADHAHRAARLSRVYGPIPSATPLNWNQASSSEPRTPTR